MKKVYDPIKKTEDELGNFETPQHTQKADTPHFISVKVIQFLY